MLVNKKNRNVLIVIFGILLVAAIGVLVFLILNNDRDIDNTIDETENWQELVPEGTKKIDLSNTEGNVEINEGGNYLLTGETRNAVNVASKEETTLYLQNARIGGQTSAITSKAEKLTISPLENTENAFANTDEDGSSSPLISVDGDFEITAGGVIILKNSNPENECIKAKRFLMNPGMQVSYINCEFDNVEVIKP